MTMNNTDYQSARNQYHYPAWRLNLSSMSPSADKHTFTAWGMVVGASELESSKALDDFHFSLLNSHSDDDLLLGLISVVYWGFVSGKDGKLRNARALKRAVHIADGRAKAAPQAKEEILKNLHATRMLVAADDFSGALLQALQIKFLGMAFASKLIAFMSPDKAGVYDSVISGCLSNSSSLHHLYVSANNALNKQQKIHQADTYAKWCAFCKNKASELNEKKLKWQDWNGDIFSWRAIDVERAFFMQTSKK